MTLNLKDLRTMSATTRIPLPAHLTVAWEQPHDEQLFWSLDRMHFPNPLSHVEDTVMRTGVQGMSYAFDTYDIPLSAHARRFWTYHYSAMAPLTASPEQLEEMARRSEEKLGAAMAQLGERWERDWLPEIQEHLAYWEAFDLRGAAMPDLLDHLDETLVLLSRLWAIHFEIVLPSYLAISLFDEFYRDLFGAESAFAAYELLQGLDNRTVDAGLALWRLSREVLATPVVRRVIEETTDQDVIPALETFPEGHLFLVELYAYLAEFGRRGQMWGVSYPSWIEDPSPVIKNIRDYIAQPERDPAREQAELAVVREERVAAARRLLELYPAPVREQFEFLLKAAQEGVVLSEDHGFWIDFAASHEVRRVFLELGRRFAEAGVIDGADDIFHLTIDEIRATAEAFGAIDWRAQIAARKAEIEFYRAVELPPAIGTLPPGPPPDNPIARAIGKFFGAPAVQSEDPDVIAGAAGSPGLVTGRAKVVRSLAEAGKVTPGDILVAETTSPSWTPLFATVAAVVTDTGGILSHCAVVAREYRIPAVVGTGFATNAIQDGDLIEVDGDRGIVRILGE
jgi:pyruvate,water dikinase